MIQSKHVSAAARHLVATAVSAVCLTLLFASPAEAQQPTPWWGLSQSARPSNIQPEAAENEVQELTVEATGGDVMAIEPISYERYVKGEGAPKLTLFSYDASHEEVQAALEEIYGAGNVEVSGGPGDQEGTKPYYVTFVEKLATRRLKLMNVEYSGYAGYYGGENLVGTATITEKTAGHPEDGQVVVTAENLGDGDANGAAEPITISDQLPEGLKAVAVEGVAGAVVGAYKGSSGAVTCSVEAGGERAACTYEGVLHAYETIEMRVGVVVQRGAAAEELNHASVAGGKAEGVKRIARFVHIGGEAHFGVEEAMLTPEEAGGAPDTQAGSHPFQLTSVLTLNENGEPQPIALPKDVGVLAPQGLIGNPTPFAECTDLQFAKLVNAEYNECPVSSMIGVAVITYNEPSTEHLRTTMTPIFNMVPNEGEPARFGFYARIVPVFLDTSVRTGEDYGVTVASHNTVQVAGLISSKITLWGVPGDPRHDNQRGWACLEQKASCSEEGRSAETAPPPFLMLPTSCEGPMQTRVQVNSWADRRDVLSYGLTEDFPALDGCNHLPFAPEITVAPDVEDASSASGLTVGIHVPQKASVNAEELAEATVRNTTITLPAGMTLNPGGADGLEACTETEIGFLGKASADANLNLLTSGLPNPFCPDGAKVGTVDIHTPLLPNDLTGAVYLGVPAPAGEAGQNPFNGLVSMYIVAEDPVSGTLVKLAGEVIPCERAGQVVSGVTCRAAGQLVSTFNDTPELPFEDLTLHFFGGGRAPLATPSLCGSYTTTASITPWSGNAAATPSSTFTIDAGPNGSVCPSSPAPFTPEFNAGTTNNQAGGYSELRTTMGHPDEDQALGALKMTLPPGVMGSLSHVKLCGEPQAAEGTCGPESLIGHTTVTAGLGSTPAIVARPGNVYITGPYKGAPYGLSIANPAETGPFDLEKGSKCDCIVVRARVNVSPHTAQLEIESDRLPTMLKGIPLDLQHVSVQINRPQFTFNPTNCDPMNVTGSLSGAEGAVSPISEHFQVANCARLPFKPVFEASTSARSSRKNGVSLHVSVTYPKGSIGSAANLKYVQVKLPRALPSRLSTLKEACVAATFATDPTKCPAESAVGHAVVHTPILPVPLEGAAYFVSEGSEWPELIMVLKGYGVTVQLVGETLIKKGVTTSTFKSTPDVPFESFELTLPQGKYSALTANGNLCKQKLVMPTRMIGQNGTVLEQKTTIHVGGCKPAIYVQKKHVHGGKATIVVQVPSGGKLIAGGKGIGRVVKHAKKAGHVVVGVHVKGALARRLHHSHRHVSVRVHLTFKRKHGKALHASSTKVRLR